ncbi:MAG: lipase secretion chaperone [Gammaproteobacteria bacterium]
MRKAGWQSKLFVVGVVLVPGWILLNPLWEQRVRQERQPASLHLSAPAVVAPTVTPAAELAQWVAKGRELGERPASLTGTQVDGALQVDTDGNLVIDLGVRRVFDYFLATIGEESLEEIRARLALYLQQHLPAAAAQQAWDVLTRYLDYKDALAELPGHDGSYDGMRDSLQRARELRDAMLGPTLADGFFREEDEYADVALQYIDYLRDPALTAQEKQQRVEALLSNLPDNARQEIQSTGRPLQIEQSVQTLREQGASSDDIWLYREQQFGSAAADRLAALDAQRAQWQQRYEYYRQQRAAIETSALDDSDKAAGIIRLRAEQFSDAEQKRVDVLDRITVDKSN